MPTVPSEIALWLACLGALLFIYNQGNKAFANFTGKGGKNEITPQPLLVQAADPVVGKNEHSQLVLRVTRVEMEVKELRDERKKDIGDLHEKINGVRDIAMRLESTTEMINQQMQLLGAKLDRTAERAAQQMPHHRP